MILENVEAGKLEFKCQVLIISRQKCYCLQNVTIQQYHTMHNT